MAFDAARSQVVLFGGVSAGTTFGDTWAWDGTDWTERTPVHSPSPRTGPGMAYDIGRSQVVQFGGGDSLGDTWTWGGTDWTQRLLSSINLSPRSGPPETVSNVSGSGFAGNEFVKLTFVDSTQGTTLLETVQADSVGAFTTQVAIPLAATPGKQHVKAKGVTSGEITRRGFTVT